MISIKQFVQRPNFASTFKLRIRVCEQLPKFCEHEQASASVILSRNSIDYTSTCETAVRHSDWLCRLFSHVKIKRVDFYKCALWNKILVLCVIKANKHNFKCTKKPHQQK